MTEARRIVAWTSLTLDGYTSGPEGTSRPPLALMSPTTILATLALASRSPRAGSSGR